MTFINKIKYIDARFSELWILDKKFVIKKMKGRPVWKKGGKVVASSKKRIENSITAYKKMPDFFPQIVQISKDTYVREYFNIPLLYDEPQKLEYVISVLKKFYLASINKSEVKEGIKKIPFYGKLWKIGLSQFPNLAVNKNDYKIIPVYILGDAKPENILTRGKYLSYDNESFCIGDISSDLELIVEHYQFFKKEKLLKKTLELSQRVFSDIDNKIVEKTLLGLIAMKKMELDTCSGDICRRERNWLLNDAINLFKKYRN